MDLQRRNERRTDFISLEALLAAPCARWQLRRPEVRALFNAKPPLMATPGGDYLRFPGKCEAGGVSPYSAGSLSPL